MLTITAHGNIGKDPEMKFHPNGNQVTKFTLAARTGKDEATWLNCSVWGKQAETAANYLRKGAKITIAGKARVAKYETQSGEKRQSFEVTVSEFTLPPRQDSQNTSDVPF